MIVAKTVVPDRYWILKEDDRKIGNIEAEGDGFRVKINDHVEKFNSLNKIKRSVKVEFESVSRSKKVVSTDNSVYGYPTTSKPYNAIYDVRHQVPLWTHEPRSKSWYAAGWYRVKQGRNWTVEQCPKLIMLERYEFRGPFHTLSEAESA
jgi:hypothetical protein